MLTKNVMLIFLGCIVTVFKEGFSVLGTSYSTEHTYIIISCCSSPKQRGLPSPPPYIAEGGLIDTTFNMYYIHMYIMLYTVRFIRPKSINIKY